MPSNNLLGEKDLARVQLISCEQLLSEQYDGEVGGVLRVDTTAGLTNSTLVAVAPVTTPILINQAKAYVILPSTHVSGNVKQVGIQNDAATIKFYFEIDGDGIIKAYVDNNGTIRELRGSGYIGGSQQRVFGFELTADGIKFMLNGAEYGDVSFEAEFFSLYEDTIAYDIFVSDNNTNGTEDSFYEINYLEYTAYVAGAAGGGGGGGDASAANQVTGHTILNNILDREEGNSSSSAVGNIAAATNSGTVGWGILDTDLNRIGMTFYNQGNADLYILLEDQVAQVISTTNYTVKLVKDAYYETPYKYTGRVQMLSTGTDVRVTKIGE